jgi:hypothetical protein
MPLRRCRTERIRSCDGYHYLSYALLAVSDNAHRRTNVTRFHDFLDHIYDPPRHQRSTVIVAPSTACCSLRRFHFEATYPATPRLVTKTPRLLFRCFDFRAPLSCASRAIAKAFPDRVAQYSPSILLREGLRVPPDLKLFIDNSFTA